MTSRWRDAVGYGWIGVDLDATLAEYHTWGGPEEIGKPIPKMLRRVKKWLKAGVEVRIFTARAADTDPLVVPAIHRWCEAHVGRRLTVTNIKDYQCVEIWDDRAVGVVPNTGRPKGTKKGRRR